jgi:hypothetical protein
MAGVLGVRARWSTAVHGEGGSDWGSHGAERGSGRAAGGGGGAALRCRGGHVRQRENVGAKATGTNRPAPQGRGRGERAGGDTRPHWAEVGCAGPKSVFLFPWNF